MGVYHLLIKSYTFYYAIHAQFIAKYFLQNKKSPEGVFLFRERVKGIEPSSPAWKASIINHYTTPACGQILIQEHFYQSFGLLGIEPSQRAPKARVLPVYDSPIQFAPHQIVADIGSKIKKQNNIAGRIWCGINPTFKRHGANLLKRRFDYSA